MSTNPKRNKLEDAIVALWRNTSSRELLMNPVSLSKAKSITLGIISSAGGKLYTRDRGSRNQ